MKRIFTLLTSLCLGLFACVAQSRPATLEEVLLRLDETVRMRERYDAEMDAAIERLRAQAMERGSGGVSSEYELCDKLYGLYANYNIDSAMHYAGRKADLAFSMGNRRALVASQMNLAGVYTNAGMYAESMKILDRYGESAREIDISYYYHICHALSAGLHENAVGGPLESRYYREKDAYRDSLLMTLDRDDVAYTYVRSEQLIDRRQYREAIEVLTERYNAPETTNRQKAILDYSLAVAYMGCGEPDMAKLHYAQCAITDLMTSTKEYKALQELALLLHTEGDIDRAYDYIVCSLEDIVSSNASIRTNSVTKIFPLITQSYEETMKRKNLFLWLALAALILLLIVALVLILQILRKNHRIHVVQARKDKALAQLRVANEELKESNEKLQQMTTRLMESNRIKDEYVARYMELSSDYIDRFEEFRRSLVKISNTQNHEDVINAIKVPSQLHEVIANFYDNFDRTFLHLFPTFVQEVNALLRPEEQLVPKSGALLNTSLRLLALVRLGVTDSAKIAHLLRCSMSTVYNYRTRLRAAMIDPDMDLEKAIGNIGTLPMEWSDEVTKR